MKVYQMKAYHYDPDWNDAPEWANWWALDKNGESYWFESRPALGTDAWIIADEHTGSAYKQAYEGGMGMFYLAEWKQKIVQRPATTPLEHVPNPFNKQLSEFFVAYAAALLKVDRPELQVRYSDNDKWKDFEDYYPNLEPGYRYRLKPVEHSKEFTLPDGRKFLVFYDEDGINGTQLAPN